ncbi:MAG: glycerate kinase [Clostridiales Family XIII bacterium]|jgi:glycerate kinase|nr:glycerate kinase [Clostridiales Family XIII bacterium]
MDGNLKIIAAPDSFKGGMSAKRACAAIAEGVHRVFPKAEVIRVPMSDGGEGALTTIVEAAGGFYIRRVVENPLGETRRAKYGIIPSNFDISNSSSARSDQGGRATENRPPRNQAVETSAAADRRARPSTRLNPRDGVAVIELAETSGLCLIRPESRNPLRTSTYGFGQLIINALNMGYRRFLLAIGGSATNDCGAGMAEALGFALLDDASRPIPRGGGGLEKLRRIDASKADKRLADCVFDVACDVSNPLCGVNGASLIFGPQKGANLETAMLLDANLSRAARVIKRDLGVDVIDVPGAGAAGGLGGGLIAFCGARLTSGVDLVLNAVRFKDLLKGAALVFTGEGRCDGQTLNGKTSLGVAEAAKEAGVPVILLAGSIGAGIEPLYGRGVTGIFSISNSPMTIRRAIKDSPALTADCVERLMRLLGGMKRV